MPYVLKMLTWWISVLLRCFWVQFLRNPPTRDPWQGQSQPENGERNPCRCRGCFPLAFSFWHNDIPKCWWWNRTQPDYLSRAKQGTRKPFCILQKKKVNIAKGKTTCIVFVCFCEVLSSSLLSTPKRPTADTQDLMEVVEVVEKIENQNEAFGTMASTTEGGNRMGLAASQSPFPLQHTPTTITDCLTAWRDF